MHYAATSAGGRRAGRRGPGVRVLECSRRCPNNPAQRIAQFELKYIFQVVSTILYMSLCEFEECEREASTANLCQMHYRRQWRRKSSAPSAEGPWDRKCEVPGCPTRPHKKFTRCARHRVEPKRKQAQCQAPGCEVLAVLPRGICSKHAALLKKYGQFERPPDAERVLPVGTRRTLEGGYVSVKYDDGWELEHRRVMEQHLGRKLFPKETVHHKNGVQNDNRLSNLELWASQHPRGQRVEDLVEFARFILRTYEPEALV